ncbi:MAG: hypothetical protein JRH20_20190 [Deltaproteobacteria bacterium]|nr:hypothetical protein [Deltaproteobacteria bacterium]
MAGRKIRDEKDARACLLAAKAAAGLSQAEWAREHGIDGRSLCAWGNNLGRGEKPRGKPKKSRRKQGRLVELIPARGAAGAACLVRCGRFSVEIGQGVDEATLARVLRVVAAC